MEYRVDLNNDAIKKLALAVALAPCLIFSAGFLVASQHYGNVLTAFMAPQQAPAPMAETRQQPDSAMPSLIAEANAAETQPPAIPEFNPAPETGIVTRTPVLAQVEINGEYSVQLAAFKDEANALGYAAQMRKRGYPAEVMVKLDNVSPPLYRVIYGHFEQRDKARLEALTFTTREKQKAVILERS